MAYKLSWISELKIFGNESIYTLYGDAYDEHSVLEKLSVESVSDRHTQKILEYFQRI